MADSEWVCELVVKLPINAGSPLTSESFEIEQSRAQDLSIQIAGVIEQYLIDESPVNVSREMMSVVERRALRRASDCPTPGYSHVFREGEQVVCVRRDHDQGLVPGDLGIVLHVGPHGIRIELIDVLIGSLWTYPSHAATFRFWEVF